MILDKVINFETDDFTFENVSKLNINKQELIDEISLVYDSNSEINYNIYDSIIVQASGIKTDNYVAPFSEKVTLILGFMQAKGLSDKYCNLLLYVLDSPGEIVNKLLSFVENDNAYKILTEEYNRYITNSVGYLQLRSQLLEQETQLTTEQLNTLIEEAKKLTEKVDFNDINNISE